MDLPLNGRSVASAYSLPVLKVNARSQCELVLQSASPVLLNTHWLGRRFWCAGDDCPGCEVAPTRGAVYAVALLNGGSQPRPVLIETSPSEWSRLLGFTNMEGWTLSTGLVMRATRAKPRSPVRFEPIGSMGKVVACFVPERRALAAAAVLANMPQPGDDVSLDQYFDSVAEACRQAITKAIVASQ